MAQIDLRGKTITIDDDLYNHMKERFFEFDELDCKDFISAVLTTGDFDTGFSCPDIDEVIEKSSEDRLSELITKGAEIYKRDMK